VLDAKIDAQLKAGKLEVDLAVFQTLQDFVRWKAGWKTPQLQAARVRQNRPQLCGPERSLRRRPDQRACLRLQSQSGEARRRATLGSRFLAAAFKGKVVSCYPADDDATLYAFYSIVQKYGWKYMDRYMANEPSFHQGHLGVVRSIASGESLVTFDTIASISIDQKNLGLTQAIAFSQDDPLPILAVHGSDL